MQDTTTTNVTVPIWRFWNKSSRSAAQAELKGPGLYSKLPSYGQAYMDLLIGEFNSLRDICANDKAKDLALELIKKAEAGETMTWGDAYMLDTAIAQMLPQEYLHQRAWCLEAKYRDAAGNADAYDTFMKAESPHLVNETEEHLRARIHNVIRELYRLYTVISCREDMRDTLSKSARKTLLTVFAMVAVYWSLELLLRLFHQDVMAGWLHYGNAWAIVFTAGAIGGVLSLQRRLQSLPRHGESLSDLVELSGRMSVRFTPILGGIFAVILFLIFAAGFATGGLFPKLDAATNVSGFGNFIKSLQPMTVIDWGKLLVWSFIAGFAERFVPDTLDRLIARSEQSRNKAS